MADAESLMFADGIQNGVVRENVFENGERIGIEGVDRGIFADNTLFDSEFDTDGSVTTQGNQSL